MSKKKTASRSKPASAKKSAVKPAPSKKTTKKTQAKTKAVSKTPARPSTRSAAEPSALTSAAVIHDRKTIEAAINELERQNTELDGLIDKVAGADRTGLRQQQLALIGTITSLRARVVAIDTAEYRAFTEALDESAAKIEAAQAEIAQVAKVISAVARLIDAATRLLALA